MAYDGSLIFDTKVDDKGFRAGVSKLKATGANALKTVNQAAKYTAIAIGAIGAASIKVGSDFEAGMSRVKAISGATGREFEALERTAMELGKTTVFSSTQASQGMQMLATAGFDTNEIIQAMPGLLDAAAAGQVDLATASDITSNVLRGFNIDAEDTGRVADVLTKAFTTSNTTMESLGETMKYVAPVASAAGFSLEEVAAASGILGDKGIVGSQAGTTLRAVMLRLINPPKQAAEALDQLGVSLVDSSGQMKPFYEIIGDLEEATKDMTDAQRTANISQIAGQQAASGLIAIMDEGGDALKEYTKDLENAGGTAEKVANEQLDNLQGDLKLLGSVLETVGIKIYKSFDGPLRQVVQTLTRYIEKIANTINAHEEITESLDDMGLTLEDVGMDLEKVPTGFEGVAIVLGEILADMVTKVAEFAPKILNAAKNLMISFLNGIRENKAQILTAATEIITSMIETYIAVIPEMLVLGIEFITGLINGMALKAPDLIKQATEAVDAVINVISDNAPVYLESGAKIIVSLIQGITSMLPNLISKSLELVESITDTIIKYLPAILESGIMIILSLVEGMGELLPMVIEFVIELIEVFVVALVEQLPNIIETGIEVIIAFIEGLNEALPNVLESALTILLTLITGILENLPLLIEAAIGVVEALIDFIFDNLDMIVDAMLEVVMAMVEGLINNIDRIIDAAFKLMEALITGILDNLPKILNAGIELILGLVDGLLEMLPTLVGTGIDLIMQLIATIVGLIPRFISVGLQLVGELVIGLVRAIPRALRAGVQLVKAIGRGIKSGFVGIGKIGANLVKGLWEGIKGMGRWIRDKVKGFASGIMDSMKSAFGIKSPSTLMRDIIGKNLTLGIGVGIEEGMPELNRDVDRELTDFTRRMEAVVELETAKTGYRAAGTSTYTTRGIIKEEKASEETPVSGDLYTVIEVEGKEMMRTMTPYMSEELYRLIRGGY